MQAYFASAWRRHSHSPSPCLCLFVSCLTPQFDLQVFCTVSPWLLKYSANTSMCYCSLLLCETAGIFHRSGLSIKLFSPDRLCWWISLRLPCVEPLLSVALLSSSYIKASLGICPTTVLHEWNTHCKTGNWNFLQAWYSWTIFFLLATCLPFTLY